MNNKNTLMKRRREKRFNPLGFPISKKKPRQEVNNLDGI